MSGVLYLVPVPISENDPVDELAPRVIRTVSLVRYFIVENHRSARRFLSKVMDQEALDASHFGILDEHTKAEDFAALLDPVMAGIDGAIISEAGSPCVADPGSDIVALAHSRGVKTVPLPGPSSILLAVMASGMGGQRWAFRGYLPPDTPARERALKELEVLSSRDGAAQVFIETPYRNDAMTASAVRVLSPETLFCAAVGLSSPEECVFRMSISRWRSGIPTIGKTPAVFLILSAAVMPVRTPDSSTTLHTGHAQRHPRDDKSRLPGKSGKR
jgi:16S rRNA (cytidine1402-2'-O)-methyltransferase